MYPSSDVLVWRLIGAAAWAIAGIGLAAWVWETAASPALIVSPWSTLTGAFSLTAWWRLIKLGVAHSIAFAAHTAVITTVEPSPAFAGKILGSPTSRASLLASKALGRAGSVAGLVAWGAYVAAHATSALLALLMDPKSRSTLAGSRWPIALSVCLALVHTAHVIYWSQDVICFPIVQRHRYFRLKRRVPWVAAQAARNSALACGLALGADALLNGGRLALPLSGVLAAWLAASLCCFAWLLGVAALDVVLSERLRPEDYPEKDVLSAMAACLDGKQGVVMQDLALQDYCCLAYERGRGAWRRLDVFADDSGERWRPLGQFCIREINELTSALAEALPQSQPKKEGAGSIAGGIAASGMGGKIAAAGGGAARAPKKWNALPLAAKGALSVSRAQLQALAAVRGRYQRTAAATRTLAGFGCASLTEDKYGVLQLSRPGLGEVLLCLLSALHACQHFAKLLATLAPRHVSMGPWRGRGDATGGAFGSQSVDAAVLALQDTLSTCLYSLAGTFGDGLAKVLKETPAQPAFGSPADAAALLQGILKGQV